VIAYLTPAVALQLAFVRIRIPRTRVRGYRLSLLRNWRTSDGFSMMDQLCERLSLLCNSDVTGSLTSDLRPRLMPVVASQLAGVGWIFDDGSIKQPWLRSCRKQSQRDDRR